MKQTIQKPRATHMKFIEAILFLVLGVMLGIMLQAVLGNFWMTLIVGFVVGSIISALSDHYRGLVADIIRWFRKPVKQTRRVS